MIIRQGIYKEIQQKDIRDIIEKNFNDFMGNFSAQTGQKSTILMKVSWCEIKSYKNIR